jgi:hypothetical protein
MIFMIVPAVFSLGATKILADMDATKLWFELTFVATTAIKLAIAGCLYAWCGHHNFPNNAGLPTQNAS